MYDIKPLINQMKEKGLKSTKFDICDKNDKTAFTININKNDDKYNLELIVSDHIKNFLNYDDEDLYEYHDKNKRLDIILGDIMKFLIMLKDSFYFGNFKIFEFKTEYIKVTKNENGELDFELTEKFINEVLN